MPRAALRAAIKRLARVELARFLGEGLAHRTGHREADVGVDVDLAHAALDAALDLLDRHAVGLLDVASVLANDRQPLLRHARRAVHHEVGVRHLRVDGGDAVHREDVAGRLAGELVGAMAGADGNGERVDAGARDEVLRLRRVGEHHVVRQCAFCADTVFLAGLPGLERAEAAEFALDRHAHHMRHLADAARHLDVVVVARGRLGVFLQRAVHHHAGEAGADRLLADRRARAMVLVQHERDVRVLLDGGEHHVPQVGLARVLARAGRGLQDHRAAGFFRRFHDGLDLLQVVDVEGGHAVAVVGGVVEQLAQGDECHVGLPGVMDSFGRQDAAAFVVMTWRAISARFANRRSGCALSDRLAGVVAIGHGPGGDRGVARGFHVGARIADVGEADRPGRRAWRARARSRSHAVSCARACRRRSAVRSSGPAASAAARGARSALPCSSGRSSLTPATRRRCSESTQSP